MKHYLSTRFLVYLLLFFASNALAQQADKKLIDGVSSDYYTKIIESLKEGANPLAKSEQGLTAFELALQMDNEVSLRLLLCNKTPSHHEAAALMQFGKRHFAYSLLPLVQNPRCNASLNDSLVMADQLRIEGGRGDYAAGRYEQALAKTKRSATLLERLLGAEAWLTLKAKNDYGIILLNTGHFDLAQYFLEQAFAGLKKHAPTGHPYLVANLASRSNLALDIGQYKRAKQMATEAVQMAVNILGADDPATMFAKGQLSKILYDLGDYVQAIALLTESVALRKKIQAWPQKTPYTTQQGRQLGRVERAYNPAALGLSLNNLGGFLMQVQAYPAAYTAFKEVVDLYQNFYSSPTHITLLGPVLNMAKVLEGMKQYQASEAQYLRALEIAQKHQGKQDIYLSRPLTEYASFLMLQGRFKEASPLLQQSIAIHQNVYPSYPNKYADIEAAYLLSRWQEGHPLDSTWVSKLVHTTALINESLRTTLLQMTPQDLQNWSRNNLRVMNDVWLTVLGSRSQTDEQAWAGYPYLLQWKGLVAERLRLVKAFQNVENTPLYREWSQTQTLLSRYHRFGTTALVSQPKLTNLAREVQAADSLFNRRAALERELVALLPEEDKADVLGIQAVHKVQAALKPEEVFIDLYYHWDYAQNQGGYKAIFVPWTGRPYLKDLGSLSLNGEWQKSDSLLVKEVEPLGTTDFQALQEKLWKPLTQALPEGTKHLVISPSGPLQHVPWSALSLDSPLTVSQVISARSLVWRRQRSKQLPSTPGKQQALILGGLDYGPPSSKHAATRSWAPLLYTRQEAKDLSNHLSKSHTIHWLKDKQATKTRILQILPQAEYVHIATHGEYHLPSLENPFMPSHETRLATRTAWKPAKEASFFVANPLLYNILALSNANKIEQAAQNELSADELLPLNLGKVKLVTISACESGAGKSTAYQGILGFRIALDATQAQLSLTSLWTVSDEYTQVFMRYFYTAYFVEKKAATLALKKAQAQMYATHPDPYFWASWILSGVE